MLQFNEPAATTISEFCKTHGISRSHYYALRRKGCGPAEMRPGTKRLISREAAAAWRRQMERGAEVPP